MNCRTFIRLDSEKAWTWLASIHAPHASLNPKEIRAYHGTYQAPTPMAKGSFDLPRELRYEIYLQYSPRTYEIPHLDHTEIFVSYELTKRSVGSDFYRLPECISCEAEVSLFHHTTFMLKARTNRDYSNFDLTICSGLPADDLFKRIQNMEVCIEPSKCDGRHCTCAAQ